VLVYQHRLIPSVAHDEQALADTYRAFEHALGILVEVMEDDRFACYLEIPPIEALL
jgi:hypothetical protein